MKYLAMLARASRHRANALSSIISYQVMMLHAPRPSIPGLQRHNSKHVQEGYRISPLGTATEGVIYKLLQINPLIVRDVTKRQPILS